MLEEMKKINPSKSQLIYIVVCAYKNDFFIKIGRSSNLNKRIKNIQTGCPHPINNIFIVFSEYGEEIFGLEKILLKLIDKYKLKGEWYLGSEEFFDLFNSILVRINSGILGDLVLEDEDRFSYEEVEILFHIHNYRFYEIELPIKKKGKFVSNQLLNPIDIYMKIQNYILLVE
ncbi:GIY-YIG nuclease family protein [Paenibacillus periandrae]|uniref:GIY-YIG nuclease family protein n=1 Tax=Paenibacillus periandrae TaxID=1761741 RepID=UPI001F09B3B9|nr:GIY-YIG nuclease family protein [Paenibacillus periandrae]